MYKIFLFSIFIIVIGCTQRIADFTVLSTKNIDITNHSLFKGNDRIIGEDRTSIIIFIPLGSPDVKEAIDNAIESKQDCVGLVDGVIYSKFWYIPYIYGESWFEVEGTPIFVKK